MKKYILQYVDKEGVIRYHFSNDGNGASYALTTNPDRASRFYYKTLHEKQLIEKLIKNDRKKWWSMCQTANIIEIHEPPTTYFEFCFFFEHITINNYIHKNFQKTLPIEGVNSILEKHKDNLTRWSNPNCPDAKQYAVRLRITDLSQIRDDNTRDDPWYYYREYYNWILPRYKGKLDLNEI